MAEPSVSSPESNLVNDPAAESFTADEFDADDEEASLDDAQTALAEPNDLIQNTATNSFHRRSLSLLNKPRHGLSGSESESSSGSYDVGFTLINEETSINFQRKSLPSPDSSSSISISSDSEVEKAVFNLALQQSSRRSSFPSTIDESDYSDLGPGYEFLPSRERWQRTRVGPEYQAVVSEGLSKYDDAPPYENKDRLLWDPNVLSEDEVLDFLKQWRRSKTGNGDTLGKVPTGNHVRDDEQALFVLLQCGHDTAEALRRRSVLSVCPIPVCVSFKGSLNLWSEEECRSFETGIKLYGKNFHQIQLNKVKTRAVNEIVQFYYFWKKTARHDAFATENRTEKKKYLLHPGATDFMERYLEEQEAPILPRAPCTRNSRLQLLADNSDTTSKEVIDDPDFVMKG